MTMSPDLEASPGVEPFAPGYEALTPEQAAASIPPEPPTWAYYSAPTPPPAEGKRRWPFALAAVVAVTAIVGAVLVNNAQSTPIAVAGTLTVMDSALDGEGANDICTGDDDGFNDISEGAEVVISNDTGKTLAITQLTNCVASDDLNMAAFQFTASVPAGLGFYQIEVTHRGEVKFDESEMSGPALTLGS